MNHRLFVLRFWLVLILLITAFAGMADAQVFSRSGGGSYSFDASTNSYHYRGKKYTIGVDGPVSSTCQCQMCRILRANQGFHTSVQPSPQPIKIKSIPVEVMTKLVPSSNPDVETMLDIANVGPGDVVLDPGCGDGRILVAATKRGAKAIGIELNADTASKTYNLLGSNPRIKVFNGDSTKASFYDANVICLFMYPEVIEQLIIYFISVGYIILVVNWVELKIVISSK